MLFSTVYLALLLGVAAFAASIVGGIIALKNQDHLQKLLGLTAGIILGVVFFGLLPEIVDISSGTHSIRMAMIALVAGFLFFHIVEKSILISHADENHYGEHRHPHVGWASALALAGHSLLDGVGIGMAFWVNPTVGLAVATAVIAHSFSDGLNTVNLMLLHKNNRRRAISMLVIDALAPLVGIGLSLIFHFGDELAVYYLSFFAGFLLYIAAAEILPEAHSKRSSYSTIALTILGVCVMYAVTQFA